MLIVFEGMDGSGKTTQASLLYEVLSERGLGVIKTKEPGETRLGKQLRKILLDPESEGMSQRAEMLLFAADRADHVEKVIKPHLQAGNIVICDRYIPSSVAYQSYAAGLETSVVLSINNWAAQWIEPDIVFYLDVVPKHVLQRAEPTRFEAKGLGYYQQVVSGFQAQVAGGWHVINGHRSIDKIHQEILRHTLMRMNIREDS